MQIICKHKDFLTFVDITYTIKLLLTNKERNNYMTFEMKAPALESILTPQEELMFQKFVIRNPGMTKEGFKELREQALKFKDPQAKAFALFNGLVMDNNPDADARREQAGKN